MRAVSGSAGLRKPGDDFGYNIFRAYRLCLTALRLLNGWISQPSTYTTFSHPAACLGTSALCPCINGYLCLEIADCHWKCLMTSLPTLASTISMSVPGMSSIPALPTITPSSVTGRSVTTVTDSSRAASVQSTAPSTRTTASPVSATPLSITSGGGGSETLRTGSQGGGVSSMPAGSTSEFGGALSAMMTASQSGGGGSNSAGGSSMETSLGGATETVVTITVFPSTCQRRTISTTVITTDTITSCPPNLICPSAYTAM